MDQGIDDSILGGKAMANPPPGEDVVISGISGTFPVTKDVHEFRENLRNKVNMMTPNHRWKFHHPEIPAASGIILELEKYDAGFFGVHERQSHSLDIMNRLLQEKVVEAIMDAGLHPKDLENTRTGVFVASGFSECEIIWFNEMSTTDFYALTGEERSMLAHRISYFLKIKGPSYVTDTACSSSLYALDHAYRALRLGVIDNAIVGCVNLCLNPFGTLHFARLGVLTPDGVCRPFDAMGTGYVRSESAAALFLQKSKNARRMYAQVLHVKSNCDGYKLNGITYPSGLTQAELLSEFYDECGIDRYSLSFLEAHGTGTPVGDPEEAIAIDSIFAKDRKTPLLMGSVKSNIGHCEAASGICSIIKCILGAEEDVILPNINFNTPRSEIKGITEGRIKIVTETMPFEDDRGLLGVNSFGFGGANCHVLLRRNAKKKINNGLPKDNNPRLVCVSGRTKEAVVVLQDELGKNILDAEHITLLHNVFRKNIETHLYRGYVLASKSGEIARSLKFYSEIGTQKPLYIVFGELRKWYDIGGDLLKFKVFADCIHRIQELTSAKGIHILDALLHKTSSKHDDHVMGNLAVHMGIIDTLNLLQIKPTFSFGYSFGELISAYYDGALTFTETVNCGMIISEATHKLDALEANSTEEITDTSINMVNGKHLSVYETGLEDLRSLIKTDNTEIRNETWFKNLCKVIEKVKPWIQKVSSDIFSNTLVQNHETLKDDTNIRSRVLKIGNSPVYAKEDTSVLNYPTSNCPDYLVDFLQTVGSLYVDGCNPQIAKLYPPVNLPVSRGTRMISPYIKWNHARNFFVPQFNQKLLDKTSAIRVDTLDQEWSYIKGHIIDGRNLFPATAYLYLVWGAYSEINDIAMEYVSVVIENCKFIRATAIPKKGFVEFVTTIQKGTGNFEITEGGSLVVTGRIYKLDNETDIKANCEPYDNESLPLTSKDIYKELLLRGYHYKGGFRGIEKCTSTATKGYIKWERNWVTFMDNMLQLKILQNDSRLLYVPTYIAKLVIRGRYHLEWINQISRGEGKALNLPVYNSVTTGVIKCGGIQIQGLLANSINRKKDLALPVLETYTFVPNFANLSIQQSVRVNIQIILENALVYKVKSVELIDEFSAKNPIPLSPIVDSVLEDQPLVNTFLKILTKTNIDSDNVIVEDKKLDSETNCLLVIASNILARPEILKEALASLNEDGFIISRESYEYDISNYTYPELNVLTVHRTQTETMLLLQKKKIKPLTFTKITSDNFSWVPTVQKLINEQDNLDVILFADKEPNSGILGLVNCLRREPNTKNIRCVFIAEPTKELYTKKSINDHLTKGMAINVYKNGKWGTYRHLLLNDISDTESEHCFVNATVRGDLSSLRWVQGPLRQDMVISLEKELIHVYYAALNFRDVMTATGKVSADVITSDRREQECVQGFEFSGRDQRGNRVMGVVVSGALSTILLADPYLMLRIPDSWTMEEGATVMCVYSTLLYAMMIRGQLKRGETILIHSGTGGIGQAAIRLALHYECIVYTTVGTEEKRKFLKENYPQLDERHIGNSRDESFEQMVHKKTNGRGVDMVINSLSEDKLFASARCLARGGRFIEIGKFDLANNNYLNTLLLQKEASFHGVMLDRLFDEIPHVKKTITDRLRDGIERGSIEPLNTNIFKMNEIERAFRFMASGKHIGKVLIQVREPEKELVVVPSIQKLPCMARYLCDAEKTYVIVGGLGGFGLELADWLVLRGAQKLVLTSRKGVSTGYQSLRISTWISYGVVIKISKALVATKEGCKQLIEESLKLGPIGAIFNLAVILADALFENQTPDSFITAFEPKAFATQRLDELTRSMCPDLSMFVVFSSVSCGRGNPGQTNYGMANSVMERICEKRKQDGYPSLAIEWGAVGEVGLVAEMQDEHIELEISGTLQQKISSCLHVLDKLLLQQDAPIVSSMVVAKKRGGAIAADNIVDTVLNILGVSDSSVSLHSTLPELGMDSMTAVEIKQTLEREYDVLLTPKEMRVTTLVRLKDIFEEKSATKQIIEEQTTTYLGMELFFKTINDESGNNIPYTKLKSNVEELSAAPKVLLFPGIENTASLYETLSRQLNAHVTCINLPSNSQKYTIRDIANAVMPYVEEYVSKDESYNIVGYSFGTVVALEVVGILESRGYTGTIICIDGAPKLLIEMLNSFNMVSEKIFETALLRNLMLFCLPPEVVSEYEEYLFKCNSWEERVTIAIEIVKQHIKVDEDHQRIAVNDIYWRLNALKSYKHPYTKLKSNVKLCKANQTEIEHKGLSEDYDLSMLFENPVEVRSFEENHATILESESLAKTIDAYVNSSN